jgi:hypothetical protein
MEFQRGSAKAVLKQTCEVVRAGNQFFAVLISLVSSFDLMRLGLSHRSSKQV